MTQPKIIIVAGPNGAGKTTFAREFLPKEAGCQVFVNADLIAAGLSPFKPERVAVQAGRIMLQQIRQHVAKRRSRTDGNRPDHPARWPGEACQSPAAKAISLTRPALIFVSPTEGESPRRESGVSGGYTVRNQ